MRTAITLPALSFFALLVLAACQSTGKNPPPSWFAAYHADGSVEAVYPKEQYIAQVGTGESREAARANAAADISRYFSLQVEGSAAGGESFIETNGAVSAERRLDRKTVERFNTELHALRYSEPWRNRKERQWEIVAYINRKEGWDAYEPRLRSVTASFMAAYQTAGAADDPLGQYILYRAALRLGNEAGGVKDALAYAQALNPEKAREFMSAQNALSGISAKIQDILNNWLMFTVSCDNDFENIVSDAITEALRKGGFKTAGPGARGTNRAAAEIDEGRQTLEAGTFYAPRLTLRVYGGDKTLFTWNTNAERRGAWDPVIAKRQSWNGLASNIKESLLRELNAALEGDSK